MTKTIEQVQSTGYPVEFDIIYPEKLKRLSTFFRIFYALPIILISILVSGSGTGDSSSSITVQSMFSGGGIALGLWLATILMLLFRQRYPKWWFDFMLEFNRFSCRVGAYILLQTDVYPSTEEKQSVTLQIHYPDAKLLSRWLPLVKWLLALPHYIMLFILYIGVFFAVVISWFAILFTGRYPKELFNFIVGVTRWTLRVQAYAFLLTTDIYPPFSLEK